MAYTAQETATAFVLRVLRQFPDREVQIAELYEICDGHFKKENLQNALVRLAEKGWTTKESDPNRAAWWAITAEGYAASGNS